MEGQQVVHDVKCWPVFFQMILDGLKPFDFMKQLGSNPQNGATNFRLKNGGKWDDPHEWPLDLQVQEFPEVIR